MVPTEEERDFYFQETKTICLHILFSIGYFFVGLLTILSIGLLYRFLRLKLGSKLKPSAKKAIVITGTTSGIGLALARRFYRKGFTVFATYYNSEEPGYAKLREIATKQSLNDEADQNVPKLFLVYMDVRSELSIDVAANEIERLIRKFQLELYSVICNAGVVSDCSFEINRLEDIHRTVQTNLLGTVMVAKRFTLPIIKCKGRIVLVSSTSYRLMIPFIPIYTATKSAISSFADCLNEDLKRYGASCRCVCPGDLGNKSNQIFTAANCLQGSVARLSPEERELFEGAVEENGCFLDKRIKSRLIQMKDPERVADLYAVELSEDKYDFRFTRKTTIIDWLFSFVDGSSPENKKDADEMGALTAFDYAVCSKDPPRRCYSGNRFFQYVTGPLVCEYMPQVLMPVLHHLAKDRIMGRV